MLGPLAECLNIMCLGPAYLPYLLLVQSLCKSVFCFEPCSGLLVCFKATLVEDLQLYRSDEGRSDGATRGTSLINLENAGRSSWSRANTSMRSLRANDGSVEWVLALVAADA